MYTSLSTSASESKHHTVASVLKEYKVKPEDICEVLATLIAFREQLPCSKVSFLSMEDIEVSAIKILSPVNEVIAFDVKKCVARAKMIYSNRYVAVHEPLSYISRNVVTDCSKEHFTVLGALLKLKRI